MSKFQLVNESQIDVAISNVYKVLLERFGEPIHHQPEVVVGARDEGSDGKALWDDEPKEDQPWHDPSVIDEARNSKKQKKKTRAPKPKTETGAQLMTRLVNAVRTAGLKIHSQEKNYGARRVWLNYKTPTTPEDIDDRMDKIEAALRSVGKFETLDPGTSNDGYLLSGGAPAKKQFEILVTDDQGKRSIGTDVLITVFDGPRAEQERSGMDTGDLGEPWPGEPLG